jgi:predicted ATPase/DNA-binding SARP family transcriptional activator
MSPQLALHFLGTPQLSLENSPITAERRKAVALLAYLGVNRVMHSRETLSALLWPDYEQSKAFTNLRHTLWEIQQTIGEGWLDTSRDKIGLNTQADIWLDVDHFKSLLDQSHAQQDVSLRVSLLADAAKLYRNHFLTGFSLKDAFPFNEWAFAESEELRRNLAEVLNTLSEDYIALGEAEKAIPYARRLITLDPLNEASHRKLMEVYIQAGQHSAALKQYQTCEQILRKELGLDPQPETRALYKRIRKREAKPVHVEKQMQTSEPMHNLPSQLSNFIGREKEIDQVADLLRKHRLVTLAGAGGIGKTRLSLQVGQKLLNEYPDGVWFIALDSLSDPDLVPQTIASVFELHEAPGRPVLDILTSALRQKTALLILDNCEHLLDACVGLVVTLLTNCPNLRILATSREVLNMKGEATYQMPALSMPAGNDASLEQLTGYETVRMFIDRATLALTSFTLTEENAQAVIDICRKVDGIPLAIELAAAQMHMLQVSEILDQLQSSFALLSTGDRTVSSRQQTLQASLDWSWGLLTEAEQRFMRRLAVIAGGWTLEAAQAICDGDSLELTSALVKKSLIVVDKGSGRTTRYRFHEIVRQYAREKLTASGEADEVRAEHLKYFLKLSKQIEPGLHGAQQMEWFAQANDERDNLRLALEQASKTDTEAGLYISGLLHSFWESFNVLEGARWLRTFIERPESKDFPRAKAKALYTLGVLQIWDQDFTLAASLAQECLTLFRVCGDKQGEADALILLGYALQYLDRRSAADELYEQSLALARSIGDLRRQALALFRLGYDRPERQLAYWEDAIALFRKVGDQNFAANLLCVIARFRILLTGDIERAQKDLDEAVQLGLLRNKNIGIIGGLWEEAGFAKSLIALLSGDYEQAYALLQDMLTLSKELGNRMGYLWARANLGYVALRAGNLMEARTIFAETTQNFQKDGNTIGVVFAIEGLAGLSVVVGKPEHAARLIGWADATREQIINPRPFLEQTNVDQNVAACLARIGAVVFWEAYEEGKEMTLDEAVAYSLAGG